MEATETKKGLVLALVCTAQFMVSLDIAIVNVALPAVQADLGMGQSALQWVVVAYGLLLGGFLLLGGRLGDVLGRRRILLAGLTLFTAASLLAGVAWSSGVLIGARALQGFGAALISPSALSILAVTFAEGRERNRALGLFGAVAGSAGAVGVIASGLLTDGPGWRWVFFINLPVGVMLMWLAARYLPVDRVAAGRRRFDAAGAATVTGGLLVLVYALNRGVDQGWASSSTLALFAAAVVLLGAFVRIESRSPSPLVPGSSLRNRTMVAADVVMFLVFGAGFAFIFLASLLMQQALSYSPTRTGLAWLATTLTVFLGAAVAGARLVTTLGVRRVLVAGLSLMAVGLVWLTRVPPRADYVTDLLPAFLLAGIGWGLAMPSAQIGALSGVASRSVGLASGLVETMREIGGAVGVAAVATVLIARTRDALEGAGPVARQAAAFEGFQSAFLVTVVAALLGVLIASISFPRAAKGVPAPSPEEEVVHVGGAGPVAPLREPSLESAFTVNPIDQETEGRTP
jgi:EmrB/QacA subfamily drug resistance transporter